MKFPHPACKCADCNEPIAADNGHAKTFQLGHPVIICEACAYAILRKVTTELTGVDLSKK